MRKQRMLINRFAFEKWVCIGRNRQPRVLSLIATNVEPYLPKSHVLLGQPFRNFVRRLAGQSAVSSGAPPRFGHVATEGTYRRLASRARLLEYGNSTLDTRQRSC